MRADAAARPYDEPHRDGHSGRADTSSAARKLQLASLDNIGKGIEWTRTSHWRNNQAQRCTEAAATPEINAGIVTIGPGTPELAAAVINVYENIVQSTSSLIERLLGPYNSQS